MADNRKVANKVGKVVEVERVWLTSAEVLRYLGISHDVLDRMRRDAKISYYKPLGGKLLFYKKTDIDEFIRKGKVI